jgi:hypothetical protein
MRLLTPFAAALAAACSTATAAAQQQLWIQYADNYADVESFASTAVGQDVEAADDFDIVGSIERVVIAGRLCFACQAPDIQGVWVRFWEHDNGEVGGVLAEYYVADGDPDFLYDPLEPQDLDITLPVPFVATGKHFMSVQLVTSSFSSWYWMTAGNGQHEISTFRHRDGNGSNAFEPYSTPFGVVNRDLSFELWGDGTPAPSTIPILVWSQGPHFSAPAIPAASWPQGHTYSEPADDFEFDGKVTRVNMSTQVCYQCPYPTVLGARVRFYEWTASGPGMLQFEQSVPVGAGTVFQGLVTDVTLNPPFVASGKHFVSVTLQTTAPNGFEWRGASTAAQRECPMWFKSSTTGNTWAPWSNGGQPYTGDLAYQLHGLPTPVPPPLPIGDPCGDWTTLFVPEPANTNYGVMRDVAVVSSDDVWAVGSTAQYVGPLQSTGGPQIWHFDGAAWEMVATPFPQLYAGSGGVSLEAVAAVSANDVWAAGTKLAQDPLSGFVGSQVFVIHWDGSSWSEVSAPSTPSGASGAIVRDIEVIAADDIWFVGDWNIPSACRESLALHWDGSSFTRYSTPCNGLPGAGGGFGLEAVSAVSSDDVWAVGGSGDGDFPYTPVYIIHFDGSSWTHFEHTAPGYGHRLWGVEAIANDDVWAVGQYFDAYGYHAYAVHWDGSSWEFMDIPGGSAALYAQGPNDVYAVGGGIHHYDGTSWKWVDDIDTLNGVNAGVSTVAIDGAGPCELFVVGRHIPLGNLHAFSARIDLPHQWVSVASNGCDSNALPDGLVLTSGAKLGATLKVRMDDEFDRAGMTPGGAVALWFMGFAEAPEAPCGTPLAGFGLAGSSAEVMFDPFAPFRVFVGAGAWSGPGSPVEFAVGVPNDPSLAGIWIHTQGLFVQPGATNPYLLTNGVTVRVGE